MYVARTHLTFLPLDRASPQLHLFTNSTRDPVPICWEPDPQFSCRRYWAAEGTTERSAILHFFVPTSRGWRSCLAHVLRCWRRGGHVRSCLPGSEVGRQECLTWARTAHSPVGRHEPRRSIPAIQTQFCANLT